MSDLLNIGTKAVTVYKKALDVVGDNVANAETAGYSRRDIVLRPGTAVGASSPLVRDLNLGAGVTVDSVRRAYDEFLAAEARLSENISAGLSAFEHYLARLQDLVSSPGTSVSPILTEFFAAARSLEEDPSSLSLRRVFLNVADDIATRFRTLSVQMEKMKNDVADDANASVDTLNDLSQSLCEINRRIGRTTSGSQSKYALLDERDRLLQKMSALLPVYVVENKKLQVEVHIGDTSAGPKLVGVLDYSPLGLTQQSEGFGLILASSEAALSLSDIGRGHLGGLQNASTYIDRNLSGLDQFAENFVNAVNQVHRKGVDLNGVSGRNLYSIENLNVEKPTATSGDFHVSTTRPIYHQLSNLPISFEYDGRAAQWTAFDNANNEIGKGKSSVSLDGVRIDIVGNPMHGDSFVLRSKGTVAEDVRLVLKDGSQVGTASELISTTAVENKGTATLSLLDKINVGDHFDEVSLPQSLFPSSKIQASETGLIASIPAGAADVTIASLLQRGEVAFEPISEAASVFTYNVDGQQLSIDISDSDDFDAISLELNYNEEFLKSNLIASIEDDQLIIKRPEKVVDFNLERVPNIGLSAVFDLTEWTPLPGDTINMQTSDGIMHEIVVQSSSDIDSLIGDINQTQGITAARCLSDGKASDTGDFLRLSSVFDGLNITGGELRSQAILDSATLIAVDGSTVLAKASPSRAPIHVFTREGRHITGPNSLSEAEIAEFFVESNGFTANAVYDDSYLNGENSDAYMDLPFSTINGPIILEDKEDGSLDVRVDIERELDARYVDPISGQFFPGVELRADIAGTKIHLSSDEIQGRSNSEIVDLLYDKVIASGLLTAFPSVTLEKDGDTLRVNGINSTQIDALDLSAVTLSVGESITLAMGSGDYTFTNETALAQIDSFDLASIVLSDSETIDFVVGAHTYSYTNNTGSAKSGETLVDLILADASTNALTWMSNTGLSFATGTNSEKLLISGSAGSSFSLSADYGAADAVISAETVGASTSESQNAFSGNSLSGDSLVDAIVYDSSSSGLTWMAQTGVSLDSSNVTDDHLLIEGGVGRTFSLTTTYGPTNTSVSAEAVDAAGSQSRMGLGLSTTTLVGSSLELKGSLPEDLLVLSTGDPNKANFVGRAVLPDTARPLPESLWLNFRSETQFDIIDSQTGTKLASRKYDFDNIYEFMGMRFQVTGAPKGGDSIFIQKNSEGQLDNRIITQLAALKNAPAFGGGHRTFSELYADATEEIASELQMTEIMRETSDLIHEQSIAAIQDATSVSLDEEAANLMRYQQAYQASAQLVATARELFETLLRVV